MTERFENSTVIIGTSKDAHVTMAEQEYGPVLAIDPEYINGQGRNPEPRTNYASVQAKFKNQEIIDHYPSDDDEQVMATTADVVFFKDGQHYNKPEGVSQNLSQQERQAFIKETQDWYCEDAFVVYWFISFAVQVKEKEGKKAPILPHKRLATLRVKGEFHQGLDPDLVAKEFSEKVNARVPLVEQGRDGKASFSVTNSTQDQPEVPISQQLAEQLIVARVLPLPMMLELLDKESSALLADYWQLVYLTLTSDISQQADNGKNPD